MTDKELIKAEIERLYREGTELVKTKSQSYLMRTYKADDKFIAIHTKGKTVYSAHGNSEEEAKNKVLEMINKDYD